jgi:hypothetical protein
MKTSGDLHDLIGWARSAPLPERIARALVAALLRLVELERRTGCRTPAFLDDVAQPSATLALRWRHPARQGGWVTNWRK